MNKKYGEVIGKTLGTCLKVDVDRKGNIKGDYLCIRFSIDVSKSLRRGMKLHLPGGRTTMAFRSIQTNARLLLLVWFIGPCVGGL